MNKVEKLMETISAYVAKFGKVDMKFMDMKLNDGITVVRFPNDMVAKGDAVMVITEQGEMPLPDNTPENPMYTLEDGSTFTVVNGVIDMYTQAAEETEVEAPEAETPAEQSAPTAPKMEEKAPKRVIKSQVEEHVFNTFKSETEQMLLSLKEQINSLVDENKKFNSQLEEQFKIQKELSETVNFIADQPATESVEKQKIVAKKFEDMTPLEKRRYIKSQSK